MNRALRDKPATDRLPAFWRDAQSFARSSRVISRVSELPTFQEIIFSTCWEDTCTEVEALRLKSGDRALSITASGGRSLNLLEGDPAEVISVDLNRSQSRLLELKRASLMAFDRYEDHARFLGLLPARPEHRRRLGERVMPLLQPDTRDFWRRSAKAIGSGVINCGRQDRMVDLMVAASRLFLPLAQIEPVFEMTDLDEQWDYWNGYLGTPFMHQLTAWVTSKPVLNRIYRKDLYESMGSLSMGQMIVENLDNHVRARPLRESYILQRVMLGRFNAPREFNSYYLMEKNFQAAQARADRVKVMTGRLEEVLHSLPDNSLDAFSYSDIFDWIEEEDFQHLMRETVRVAKDGARICYRVCLIERRPRLDPERERGAYIEEDRATADRLLPLDRSPFYRDLYVGTERKGAAV